MTRRIRGAILDIDGTLLNSNDAHARAWVDALAAFDIQVSFADVRRLIGMGGDNLLPALAGIDEKSPLGRKISERRAELFAREHLPHVRPFPKVRQLLLRMSEAGLRLAVASSAKKEELDQFLQLANISDLITGATSSSDAENSKPDPDIVRAALSKLELEPHEVVMIGDTPYDVQAAAQLGVETIAFRSGGRSDADLAGALRIYDGAAALLEDFAESPLASPR
jgi:HAD superfamily hydrolase (TIGR01509 family)